MNVPFLKKQRTLNCGGGGGISGGKTGVDISAQFTLTLPCDGCYYFNVFDKLDSKF